MCMSQIICCALFPHDLSAIRGRKGLLLTYLKGVPVIRSRFASQSDSRRDRLPSTFSVSCAVDWLLEIVKRHLLGVSKLRMEAFVQEGGREGEKPGVKQQIDIGTKAGPTIRQMEVAASGGRC